MNGPQISLHMPRIVESNATIFSLTVQGDLVGLKNLFQAGLASPYDVAASNGRTALHVSLRICVIALAVRLMSPGLNLVCCQLQSSRNVAIFD